MRVRLRNRKGTDGTSSGSTASLRSRRARLTLSTKESPLHCLRHMLLSQVHVFMFWNSPSLHWVQRDQEVQQNQRGPVNQQTLRTYALWVLSSAAAPLTRTPSAPALPSGPLSPTEPCSPTRASSPGHTNVITSEPQTVPSGRVLVLSRVLTVLPFGPEGPGVPLSPGIP